MWLAVIIGIAHAVRKPSAGSCSMSWSRGFALSDCMPPEPHGLGGRDGGVSGKPKPSYSGMGDVCTVGLRRGPARLGVETHLPEPIPANPAARVPSE
jgi:hypothetical protein